MDVYLDNYRYLKELIIALIDFTDSKYSDVYGHISDFSVPEKQDYSKGLTFTIEELSNGIVASCFEYGWQSSTTDVIRDNEIFDAHVRNQREGN